MTGRKPMSAEEIARRSAAAMWSEDRASRWLGIELGEVGPGRAVARLSVKAHHCNGHGILHGGFTFTLADTAFAFACNSRNQNTVAQLGQITFLAPGREGDVLTAEAVEVHLQGRSGVYDVTVTRQDGTRIALFRGHSRAIPGQLFETED